MFSGEMRVERRARGAWLPLVALIICFEVHRPAGAPETRPPLYLAVSPSGRKFAVPPEPPALSLRPWPLAWGTLEKAGLRVEALDAEHGIFKVHGLLGSAHAGPSSDDVGEKTCEEELVPELLGQLARDMQHWSARSITPEMLAEMRAAKRDDPVRAAIMIVNQTVYWQRPTKTPRSPVMVTLLHDLQAKCSVATAKTLHALPAHSCICR